MGCNWLAGAGILVLDTVLEHWAAAEAVLTDDEKEFGAALVDIGGETTNLAVYHRGSVQHTAVLPIGGHYTMGPRGAGLAAEMTGASTVVPVHYATFPALAGTPDQLRDETSARVVELEPGETYEHHA